MASILGLELVVVIGLEPELELGGKEGDCDSNSEAASPFIGADCRLGSGNYRDAVPSVIDRDGLVRT